MLTTGVYTSSCKSICGYRLTPCCVIAVSERKATLTFIHRKMSLIITSNVFEKKTTKKNNIWPCADVPFAFSKINEFT